VLELLEMAALTELSAAIEPLLQVREGMRTERKAFDRTLASAARRSDVGSAFDDDPRRRAGDHPAYIATVDDPGRFGTSKALGAHLGLTPRVYQSGRSTDQDKSASAAIECCVTFSMRPHRH
jgi:transposase